jgi:hypothetical protein
MEEERKINENTGNMLKQALERRQTERLSSNFSYRMMERVHQEAEKQTKRKTRVGWAALLISALALVGLGVYVLTFYRCDAANECPAGFFFVWILCLYRTPCIGLARIRLLAAQEVYLEIILLLCMTIKTM